MIVPLPLSNHQLHPPITVTNQTKLPIPRDNRSGQSLLTELQMSMYYKKLPIMTDTISYCVKSSRPISVDAPQSAH